MKSILVVNFGSSSIKFKLYDFDKVENIAKGQIEVNRENGIFELSAKGVDVNDKVKKLNHDQASEHIFDQLAKHQIIADRSDIVGIGHRVVHGADLFIRPTVITARQVVALEGISHMAPLHNPIAVNAIKTISKAMPTAANVAVFDTAFHATIPERNFLYPVPMEWAVKHKVRKYGFHGISYDYVAGRMAKELKKPLDGIICHLGSGSSIAVVVNGKSLDTSMGLTPLAGIMMGRRSGDIDPSIMSFIARQTKMSPDEIERILNNESGINGMIGVSDMRELSDKFRAKEPQAVLAAQMWVDRIASYIVRYHNLSQTKAKTLVFTAGIGENSDLWPVEIVKGINIAKVKIDPKALKSKYDDLQLISTKDSEWKVYRVRTNEELVIARSVKDVLSNKKAKKN